MVSPGDNQFDALSACNVLTSPVKRRLFGAKEKAELQMFEEMILNDKRTENKYIKSSISKHFLIEFINGNKSIFEASEVKIIENSLLKISLLTGEERIVPFCNVQSCGFVKEG